LVVFYPSFYGIPDLQNKSVNLKEHYLLYSEALNCNVKKKIKKYLAFCCNVANHKCARTGSVVCYIYPNLNGYRVCTFVASVAAPIQGYRVCSQQKRRLSY